MIEPYTPLWYMQHLFFHNKAFFHIIAFHFNTLNKNSYITKLKNIFIIPYFSIPTQFPLNVFFLQFSYAYLTAMQYHIRNTNLRFNLDKDQQRKAWEYLQTMDRQNFKSYSQVISLALVDYFDHYYRTQADPYQETREREEL